LGCEVDVYGGNGEIQLPSAVPGLTVRKFPYIHRSRFPALGTRFRKFSERASFAWSIRKSILTGGYDWLVVTKPLEFFWARLIPKSIATRLVFVSQGTDYFPGDRRAARRIGCFAACSHFNAWQLYSHFRRSSRVIFNGVNVDLFHPGAADAELRAALGFRDEEVVFAFAGRLIGWKGLHVALHAMAESTLRQMPIRLLLIGQGDALPRLKNLAVELGIADRCTFHPPLPHADLPKYYASVDAGIFPSIGDEGFGNTIAEAMACGLPVVAASNGGIPEVVGNEGNCGRLFTIADAKDCARAMAFVAADRSRRLQMGIAARQRMVRDFTWRASAERLLEALETLPEQYDA
jgi:glycosyltransferase involved in cell wall biosynthesis